MNWNELIYLIKSDLHRYHGRHGLRDFLLTLASTPGFKLSLLYRLERFLLDRPPGWRWARLPVKLVRHHCAVKYGIVIPPTTEIGSGLYIGYFGSIIVNGECRIGKNCNLSPGVNLGRANRGPRAGAPVLGDDVYLGPGAKIVGKVQVGNEVAVGANCVVTRDVPDRAVVVGVPGEVISRDGSAGYIGHTDYGEPAAASPT